VLVNGIPAPLLYAGAKADQFRSSFSVSNSPGAAIQVMTPAGPSESVTPSAPVVDIMEALKKSFAAARKPVGRAEEATGEAKSQRRTPKRQAKSR
jgi:hypothetical protein